jgi:type I site-specific restriction-modification system R (restriction) subunit
MAHLLQRTHRQRQQRDREKTVRLQEDHVQLLTRDDGTTKNVRLLDKEHIHNNRLQVINQYETSGASAGGVVRATRYDVTILVNGLPMVHVELKRRGGDRGRRSTRSSATNATASGPGAGSSSTSSSSSSATGP